LATLKSAVSPIGRRRIGLISDTHGLLRPEAAAFLAGCSSIIHGGDIGGDDVLEGLRRIAPLTAVRGNNDPEAALPETEIVRVDGVAIYAIHDRAKLDIDPQAAGIRVVVSGHSHQPSAAERDGVLFVNPGSAGRRRFKLPVAIGELIIDATGVSARIVELADAGRSLAYALSRSGVCSADAAVNR
jgi:putative phosphoesterase